MKICRETTDLVEIGQKYRTLYTKTCYCYRRQPIAMKALSCNEMVSGCWGSWGSIAIALTCHSVTSHLRCPCCSEWVRVSYTVRTSDRPSGPASFRSNLTNLVWDVLCVLNHSENAGTCKYRQMGGSHNGCCGIWRRVDKWVITGRRRNLLTPSWGSELCVVFICRFIHTACQWF